MESPAAWSLSSYKRREEAVFDYKGLLERSGKWLKLVLSSSVIVLWVSWSFFSIFA